MNDVELGALLSQILSEVRFMAHQLDMMDTRMRRLEESIHGLRKSN